MLQIQNLKITMKKDLRTLVEGLTFTLRPGDKVAVVGEEGNGKSTLLKLLYDESLVEGYAQWEGHMQKDGMLMGYLSQELPEADKGKAIYEKCLESGGFSEASPKELASLGAKLGIPAETFYSDQLMGALSGGEKVKLRMALLSLERPDCYLLDEPSNDLDLDTLRWLEPTWCSTWSSFGAKPCPGIPWPAWGMPSMWGSGFTVSRSRSRLPGRNGRRRKSSRSASASFTRRWSTNRTPFPGRIPIAGGC